MKLLITLAGAGAIFCAVSVCAVGAGAAEPITIRTETAGELAENCGANPRQPGADARINFCHGYAQGAITVQQHYAGDKKLFCLPNPAPSRAETMNQFVAWVRANPDRRSMKSDVGLFKFLEERFPCKS
ncbi:MAG TPA: Rap1a/Tai family immunity protein [Rhodopila sp.]|nr:Rap1a/Tai family immunity protein [Rhodopila sp.]